MKTLLKISTTENCEGKYEYKLYKDGRLIARGTAEYKTIFELFFERYSPEVEHGDF